MNAPSFKNFSVTIFLLLLQEMAKPCTHPVSDSFLCFRSIDLKEFFTMHPFISIYQWKKCRGVGRKEKI